MEKNRAAEYRAMAADCTAIAQLMSLKKDRDRLLEMAQRLLNLAQQAEGLAGPPQSN
jgi:hypothetical protein